MFFIISFILNNGSLSKIDAVFDMLDKLLTYNFHYEFTIYKDKNKIYYCHTLNQKFKWHFYYIFNLIFIGSL
jgi:hypothetical protein